MQERTRRAYQRVHRDYLNWCREHTVDAFVANSVALYLAGRMKTGHSRSTIGQDLAGIVALWRERDLPSPSNSDVVRTVQSDARQSNPPAPLRKDPLELQQMSLLVDVLPSSLTGARDRALLLIGWAGEFRRSELVAMTVRDLEWSDSGVNIRCPLSRKPKEARVARLRAGIHPCPVAALRTWLARASITDGAVFRRITRWEALGTEGLDSGSVARIVKRAAEAAGLDLNRYSGHSLRSGRIATARTEEKQAGRRPR